MQPDLTSTQYPPPVEYAIPTVILKLRKWNCNKIFLATEDINIVRACKNVFGEMCVTLPKGYVNYDGKTYINAYHQNRENDFYLRSKEYLMEMALVSKCNSFVTARCSGAAGVMLMAEKFENVYAFNLGKYNMIAMEDFEDD